MGIVDLDNNVIEWRQIDEFPFYEVSNTGLIRSKERRNLRSTKGKTLKPKLRKQTNRGGYRLITLYSEDGTMATRSVHRLVGKAFLPNPENKNEINHIDANKSNNHVSNLEWCTRKENQGHAIKNNLYFFHRGESHSNSKLKAEDVISIKKMYKGKGLGITHQSIADMFNVKKTTVTCILSGKGWGHIKIS